MSTLDRDTGAQGSTSELLRAISNDRALGSALCFAHRHPQESPGFHVQIMDLWRAADEFEVIEAFREAGKSTLSEEFLLLEAAFGNFKYCLIFGETYTKAVQRLSAIKHEVLRNTKLMHLFGDLKGEPWTENRICLRNGTLIEAHGWEEEIRGYKWLDARPDRAYLDDIENKSMVRDTAAVDATWRKLNTELIPAMDKERRKIRVTGTPLSDDCMINRCKASPEWTHASYPICAAPGVTGAEVIDHPQARALWPERYPMAWIRSERDRFASAGLLREFVQEYMLIAASTQGKPFNEESLRYEERAPRAYAPKVVIVDPARTSNKRSSDRTGKVIVSRMGSTVYVHESGAGYLKPDAIIADCFDMAKRHDDAEVAIERNSLDDFLLQPMRSEMLRRGEVLDLRPMLAPSDRSKDEFIMGLQPLFEAGDIILVGGKAKHQILVNEILNYPSGKRDCLNALAYIQRVFGGQAVYREFSEDNITDMAEPSQGDQLALGIYQTDTEVAAVLVAVGGRRITVLHDFVSAHSSADAIRDVWTILRAAYPNRRITTWVPADTHDQAGRNAVMEALRQAQMPAQRGGYIEQSRGCLGDLMRTSMDGVRLLQVDRTARRLLSALSSGYRYRIQSNGRPTGEPEAGVSRTLCIALECLTMAVEQGKATSQLPPDFGSALNANGVPYMSALGKRR